MGVGGLVAGGGGLLGVVAVGGAVHFLERLAGLVEGAGDFAVAGAELLEGGFGADVLGVLVLGNDVDAGDFGAPWPSSEGL